MSIVVEGTSSVAASELRAFVDRYERIEAEKKDATDGQKEIMAEAKDRGCDPKVLRKVIALRKRNKKTSRKKKRSWNSSVPRWDCDDAPIEMTRTEFHEAIKAQGVPHIENAAFIAAHAFEGVIIHTKTVNFLLRMTAKPTNQSVELRIGER